MNLSCGHDASPSERVWLREDDTTVCDDCHFEELCDDPQDRYDHGSPYPAGRFTGLLDSSGVLL